MKPERTNFVTALKENPIIAVINDANKFEAALRSKVKFTFILTGNISNLKSTIQQLKTVHKIVFVHYDLMAGFAKDTTGLEFMISHYRPDGIISTKSHMIKFARQKGMLAIQRLFLLDSLNLESGINSINEPDAIEILPGIMPRITRYIAQKTQKPIITGGLIENMEDIKESLLAGAIGISTSNQQLWKPGQISNQKPAMDKKRVVVKCKKTLILHK